MHRNDLDRPLPRNPDRRSSLCRDDVARDSAMLSSQMSAAACATAAVVVSVHSPERMTLAPGRKDVRSSNVAVPDRSEIRFDRGTSGRQYGAVAKKKVRIIMRSSADNAKDL